tara:strand:- start:412 stop:1539 length:1128 start_codon:yes stop_codon:yes gene_type:complete
MKKFFSPSKKKVKGTQFNKIRKAEKRAKEEQKDKSDDELKQLFDQHDVDNSSSLDRAQTAELIKTIAKDIGEQLTEEQCRKHAVDMDVDDTNDVTFEELMHWYRRIYPTRLEDVIAELTYEFNKFDVEKTGGLSDEEVSRLMKRMHLIKPGQNMKEIIASLPKSSLGDVRFEDFQQWHMKNHKEKYKFHRKFSNIPESKTKKAVSTHLGVMHTDFQVGSLCDVYFRVRNEWVSGYITKINQIDGTAHFESDDHHLHKWVNLVGHEHAGVLRKHQPNRKFEEDESDDVTFSILLTNLLFPIVLIFLFLAMYWKSVMEEMQEIAALAHMSDVLYFEKKKGFFPFHQTLVNAEEGLQFYWLFFVFLFIFLGGLYPMLA